MHKLNIRTPAETEKIDISNVDECYYTDELCGQLLYMRILKYRGGGAKQRPERWTTVQTLQSLHINHSVS